jgi:hypothetical protein
LESAKYKGSSRTTVWVRRINSMRRLSFANRYALFAAGALWLSGVMLTASGQISNREVPGIVREGLQAYKLQGADAALKAWLKRSPIEANPEAMSQGGMLKTAEGLYGSYQAYQVKFVGVPSRSTRLVYLVMDYERGPLFAKFVTFKRAKSWQIVSFKFHTDVEQVWPGFLLRSGGHAESLSRKSPPQREADQAIAIDAVSAVCLQPESAPIDSFASGDELRKLLAGQWLSCNPTWWEQARGIKNQVGIEFTSDGHWFALLRNASGAIVRGKGFDYEGTIQLIDMSSMNGPGRYQVNIKINGGGTFPVHPVFSGSPRKMRMNSSSAAGPATYVPMPSPRQ